MISSEAKQITISVCMIVKDEERILARGLDSLVRFADEIVIVDTGSTDKTIEIAKRYTDKVYSFKWIGDFAAARNYSFTKATMDYIYVADADEVIDEENQEKILRLKEELLPEIEIVQMLYSNQLQFGTTYNFDEEYRPKLYKRVRNFQWIDPIHETVCLDPIIYDSDIRIHHMPEENHGKRDFTMIQKVILRGERLSKKLHSLYARELYIVGEDEDFLEAKHYFEESIYEEGRTEDEILDAITVLARCYRIEKDISSIFKVCIKGIAGNASSELCYEIGRYFYEQGDYREAILWLENAAFETECRLSIKYQKEIPINLLIKCCEMNENMELAKQYRQYLE